MDEYTLGLSIRDEGARRDGPPHDRMPILALMANAVRGESRRAHAAGMDAYLTKPLQWPPLKDTLAQWRPDDTTYGDADSGGRGVRAVARWGCPSPVPDLSVLHELVGDDPQTVHQFLTRFREALHGATADMHAAQANRDVHQTGVIAQGYLIARPMLAAKLTPWLQGWTLRHEKMSGTGP